MDNDADLVRATSTAVSCREGVSPSTARTRRSLWHRFRVSSTAVAQRCADRVVAVMRRVCVVPTFHVLVFQGFLGTIPWRGFPFLAMYYRNLGFPPEAVAQLNSLPRFGGIALAVFGGYLGDWAAK
ncbi:unnamed protein product [Amoebophrya sp. A25]|nr:unnamed protein product [Amoebophrya sp. A25]|eukprot:GSA25T00002106001.1